MLPKVNITLFLIIADPGVTIEDFSNETTSSSSSSLTKSDGTKSDTICGCMTLSDETSAVIRIKKKRRNKIVTKNNQSILTDSAKLCDVSTVTSDWWSPVIEKTRAKIPLTERKREKSPLTERKREKSAVIKMKDEIISPDERKHEEVRVNKRTEKHRHKHEKTPKIQYTERSMSTDGRVVKFKSQAQIIPENGKMSLL